MHTCEFQEQFKLSISGKTVIEVASQITEVSRDSMRSSVDYTHINGSICSSDIVIIITVYFF